jgi:hypothetical protein
MSRAGKWNGYPDDWYQIAKRIKDLARWKCERCGHPHEPKRGRTLTVHHLVPDKFLVDDWNLAALCQKCHLYIQRRVDMFQTYLLPHSEWFIPHLVGFQKWQREMEEENEESCRENAVSGGRD